MGRDKQGRYSEQQVSGDRCKEGQDGEHLERIVQFRISSSEYRISDIMFSQHRGQFGWQTMSDMYRHFLKSGLNEVSKLIKKPSRDMITQIEQSNEIDKLTSEALRHRQLETLFNSLDDSIAILTRAGDLGAVREILGDFQKRSKRMTDKALKYRRDMEFDRRWGRLWEELNRGVSLDPKTFTADD